MPLQFLNDDEKIKFSVETGTLIPVYTK